MKITTPKIEIVCFLQNAWSPIFAGGSWPRDSWIRALRLSRSGLRLKHLIDDFNICENTTPEVGADPSSKLPPNDPYIKDILQRRNPQLVITCGRQAETALVKLWDGPLLSVPHPAHRLVTNSLYTEGKHLIKAGLNDRIALRQGKGEVIRETLGFEKGIYQK